jgi:hypothetical protein
MLNTYGVVWDQAGGVYVGSYSSSRMVSFPVTGSYTFQFAADNYLSIYLDGVLFANDTGLNDTSTNYGGNSWSLNTTNPIVKTQTVTAGLHKLTFTTNNNGSVGAYGVRILNSSLTEIWTTRYDTASNGTPAGGNGGYPGSAGASGMGGAGGSGTRLSIINSFGTEYPIAIAGGGGGGGGGAAPGTVPNVSKNANWMNQGWESVYAFPNIYPGGEGEYISRINNGEGVGYGNDGGGGGGAGGGVYNNRIYVQTVLKQWGISGLGGRTIRGTFFNIDCEADGGESGKSWITPYATRNADFLHVPTTSATPIFGSNIPVSLAGYGGGGGGSTSGAVYPGNAVNGTNGAAYVDWGLTNASVSAPSVSRSPVRAGAVFYTIVAPSTPPASGPTAMCINSFDTGASFTVDAWGGGGNPGTEYTYDWHYLSGDGVSFNSPSSYRTVVNVTPATAPYVDGNGNIVNVTYSGTFQVTVSDGSSSASYNMSWYTYYLDTSGGAGGGGL